MSKWYSEDTVTRINNTNMTLASSVNDKGDLVTMFILELNDKPFVMPYDQVPNFVEDMIRAYVLCRIEENQPDALVQIRGTVVECLNSLARD